MPQLRHDGFIGEGTLYIRRLDRADLGLIPMGNATSFSVAVESEVFQLTAARRRLLSASKSAKNQLITNSLSLTHSDVKELASIAPAFAPYSPINNPVIKELPHSLTCPLFHENQWLAR